MMGRRIVLSSRVLVTGMKILWRNPHFMLFPILSAIALVIILSALGFLLLVVVGFDLGHYGDMSLPQKTGLFFILYLICYLVAFFANTGLVGAVMLHLDGGTPTVRYSYEIARARSGKLVLYALIMATVGTVFRLIGQWLGIAGRIANPILRRVLVFTFVGLSWNLVTYLVVPILVVEDIGPGQALRRSTELIKKTWGEQVVAYVSTGLLFLIFFIAWSAAFSPLLSWAMGTLEDWIITGVLYLYIMVALTVFLIKLAIDSVFCAVVYRYVTSADAGMYGEEMLQSAFGAKKSRLRLGRAKA
jgi:hypothetical protein